MKTLREICWNTIILDEGHRIKNDESKITQAAQKLKARFRLILTGTPVQVSFLLFRPFEKCFRPSLTHQTPTLSPTPTSSEQLARGLCDAFILVSYNFHRLECF